MFEAIKTCFNGMAGLEGSTRPVALMRIGVGLIVWVRFADEVATFQATGPVTAVFGLGLLAFAALVIVGLFTRAALLGLTLFLGFGYFFLGGVLNVPGWHHHHVYLLMSVAALLLLSPSERSYSIDRLIRARHGEILPEWGRLWPQALIGLTLSAIYFWAAFDKTDYAFLSGQRLEQTFVWTYSGRFLEDLLIRREFLILASILVVIAEYVLAFAIHVRRWHCVVLPAGIALHAAFYLLLPVDTYSVTMVLLYLSLLHPNSVHRFIDRLHDHATAPRYL